MTLTLRRQKHERLRRCGCLASILFAYAVSGSSRSSPSQFQSPSQSPPSHEPAAPAKISVKAELVVLPVRVTDAKGSAVSGLTLQDFRVFEDGRPQKVTLFPQEDTPVTVGLIVDHSRSMRAKLPAVAAAVAAFAQSSNPQDEMFVVDFNDDVSLQPLGGKPFSNDPLELAKAVSAVSARGRTALYDAVAEGLHHLRLGHWDKKALILVSDGGDNASHQKFSQVLALAQRSQVLIYSIGLVTAGEEAEEDPGVLRRLCKSTGGLAYFPSARENIAAISTQIARDLREQYTLGFAPEKYARGAAFRKLQVKVSAPGRGKLHVRSKPGYFPANPNDPAAQTGRGSS